MANIYGALPPLQHLVRRVDRKQLIAERQAALVLPLQEERVREPNRFGPRKCICLRRRVLFHCAELRLSRKSRARFQLCSWRATRGQNVPPSAPEVQPVRMPGVWATSAARVTSCDTPALQESGAVHYI